MYSIIKIQNNNDYNKFYLDVTKMRDARIRVGILISYLKYYQKKPKIGFHPVFEAIGDGDYSFSTVYRSSTDTFEEIRLKRDELYEVYKKKYINEIPKTTSNIVSFQ